MEMEIPDVVSVRRFKEFNVRQKEELYETLLELAVAIDEIPKKSLRKTLDVSLAVLSFKGDQVERLQERLAAKKSSHSADNSSEESQDERVLQENEKLKRMLAKLEDDKTELNQKVKGFTDEILQLQKKLQESMQNAEASDKDSSDPLSELDKQEVLLRNISTKNKHIKRLLRDIESLQTKNIEQSKTIIFLEKELHRLKEEQSNMNEELTSMDNQRQKMKETIANLNVEITRLEGNVTYLEEERDKSENELKDFIEQLETKAQGWKKAMDEKDTELKKLRRQIAKKSDENNTMMTDDTITSVATRDVESSANQGLIIKAIESRDKLIEQLELKIKAMAEEMLKTTKLMDKIAAEKESERNSHKSQTRSCCRTIEKALQATQTRCNELGEMLQRSEQDNELKSKQAMQAMQALDSYQRGEDGLMKALRKCSSLEAKVAAREQQIRALITELNSMHEIISENGLLRKRLNIPDDVVITARNLAAKQRNKDKIIERLTLKLRASEEIRLQLKLDKADLRKELMSLQSHSNITELKQEDTQDLHTATADSSSLPSEVGEVQDTVRQREPQIKLFDRNICSNCKEQFNLNFMDELPTDVTSDLHAKYKEVLQENDMLRTGMQEILEKLREYDSSSDHITIESEILYRLLDALQRQSPLSSPHRLQTELQTLREREEALREMLQQTLPNTTADTDDQLQSIEEARDDGQACSNSDSFVLESPLAFIDTSTRPTTPNRSINQQMLPIISDMDVRVRIRELEEQLKELCIFQQNYEELHQQLASSETEAERHLAELQSRSVTLQFQLTKCSSSYAFMQEDFDIFVNTAKQKDMHHVEEIATIRKDLLKQKQFVETLQAENDQLKQSNGCSGDEHEMLLKQIAHLQSQLALLVGQALKADNAITDLCADYGVINDENFHLDFITAEEYQTQRENARAAIAKHNALQRQINQLEALIDIAQQQIQSQQKILHEITDNHIDLRHLVADLQNGSEDKFLLAKMQRDLDFAKHQAEVSLQEREDLRLQCLHLEIDLKAEQEITAKLRQDYHIDTKHKNVKIKFLQKSMWLLKEKYAKFTPLIFLTNFVFAYTNFSQQSRQLTADEQVLLPATIAQLESIATAAINERDGNLDESQQLLKIIKAETRAKLLEENLAAIQVKYDDIQKELSDQRLRFAQDSQHWQIIEGLFGKDRQKDELNVSQIEQKDDAIKATNASPSAIPIPATRKQQLSNKVAVNKEMVDKNTSPIISPFMCEITTQTELPSTYANSNDEFPKSASNHGQQFKSTSEAMAQTTRQNLSDRSVQTTNEEETMKVGIIPSRDLLEDDKGKECQALLEKTKQELAVARTLIKELNDQIAINNSAESNTSTEDKSADLQAGVIEKTILSFHTLLAEKDKTISKNQDMLQSEREQAHATALRLSTELENSFSTITNLNFTIRTKDMEILELKTQLEVIKTRNGIPTGKLDNDGVEVNDNSLHELTDEKIEEMFEDDCTPVAPLQPADNDNITAISKKVSVAPVSPSSMVEKQDTESMKEIPTLLKRIKELKDKITYAEQTLKVKDDELNLLREKLSLCMEREKSLESVHNPEMEQLRILLEDKDKHIHDLMETLNNFHDDQRRYINDSSNDSADRISKLAADLARTEATNKIYQTQVEALRRQLASLTQREKQARELNQSLRNQLIKRPVVSIKTELNARVKNENMQKRIQHLELELDDAKAQIQRQHILIETKRVRSASEVGLWEKQKRWQQNAEKLKVRLDETECALEKTRNLLQAARNTVNRLEKDKQVLETKLNRALHGGAVPSTTKCCRAPSCPNLHHCANGDGGGGKYTPSESPETYTGASSECSSPAHHQRSQPSNFYSSSNAPIISANAELFEALKARLELQQRKIIAMEMEGRGTNALTTEMERIQEKLSAVEAQNIRLEAKNLQLQLDNDMLRQGDGAERLQKRIKHLEDYIIALKEEKAQSEARRDLCKCSGIKVHTQQGQSAEQTILSLRNIVEKLRSENKYLKEGGRRLLSDIKTSADQPSTTSGSLQQKYNESLAKISALENALNTKKCPICNGRDNVKSSQYLDELKAIKEQLLKKTQLLEKAKVLLTRAAAKEKILKEQLSLWKRKCSELQNVPVIDEISE